MSAGADLRLLRAAVFTAVCVTLSAAGHSLAGGGRMPVWTLAAACAAVFAVAAPLAGRERSLPGIAALLAAGQLALHTLFAFGCASMRTGMAMGAGTSAQARGGGGHSALRELAGRLLCNEHVAGSLTDAQARRIVSDAGLDAPRYTAHAAHAAHATQAGHAAQGAAGPLHGTPLACLHSAAHAALSCLDGPMLLGHLLAALALGLLLRRGEAALWRLVRLSARSARAVAELVPVRALRAAVAYVTALCAGLLPHAPARVRVRGARKQGVPRPALLHHSLHRRGPPRGRERLTPAVAA